MNIDSWHAKIYIKKNFNPMIWELETREQIAARMPETTCDYYGWWFKHLGGWFLAISIAAFFAVALLMIVAYYLYGWWLICGGGYFDLAGFREEFKDGTSQGHPAYGIWTLVNGGTVIYFISRGLYVYFNEKGKKKKNLLAQHIKGQVTNRPLCSKIKWQ